MADHPDPAPRHSAQERTEHVTPPALSLLAGTSRDTAVILLAGATAVFLALAVALSLLLWRAHTNADTLAARNAAATPSTPDASAVAQPVAPAPTAEVVPGETAASAAQDAEETAHAEETTAEETAAAEETAEATATATAEASATAHATDTTAADPDLATHHYLPVTGTNVSWLLGSGLGLTLAGVTLASYYRRRTPIVCTLVDATAVEALRYVLTHPARRESDPEPQARRVTPADQTGRLQRVADRASR
ncbi:LPXTG cell wall anchor domain-containing protein [Cryptosporangium aurantiacum]|uniref:LPXTG-motif cell wall anchor domain-containing protein n=1 Tax=Cryptosporangium aurantiacum TaxID=134849 RepID=A0A1M7RMZ2_9ACTN|nr:LPXTG cell wall anchor domain-containing protein [Cryptosporangium aurantiacum]SHN47707.1 LPXTG-motif cell wall anchor domain-containing protein [Cryptosporangium aurantiacum]